MQALRLNEVLTRVVAWHNRHPLARRIGASQVHSIGEVVLPFASAQPAPPAPAPPALEDLLDPQSSALGDLQVPGHGDPIDTGPADEAAIATVATVAKASDRVAPAGPERADDALAPADLPGATDAAATEPAPVLSMEDEADDLFSNDPPPAVEPATADDDGPEMLIELSSDADEPAPAPPADSGPQPPDPLAADPAPELSASDADSVELIAAFAAATDDGPALQAVPDDVAAPGQKLPTLPATGLSFDGADAPPVFSAAQPPVIEAASDPAPAAGTPRSALLRRPHSAASTTTAGFLARLWAQAKGWRQGNTQGLPRLQATFSRDFIWPLRPGQVARWARRHGSSASLAPADWPQRLIDTDGSLLAQARDQGLPYALPLHVLTAAIGVGDRRIRVLIDAQGHILGPRSYSPPKLAALASLAALGLGGAGWGWLPQAGSLSANQTRAVVAVAASAAAQAASAAELAAAAASAAEGVWRAQQAALLLTGTAPAGTPPAEASQAGALEATQPVTSPAAPVPQGGEAMASAHDATAASSATPAQDPGAGPAPHKAVVPLGTVLPALSAGDKLAARRGVEAARRGQAAAIAAQPPKQAVPVFAIVTLPTREKGSAARGLALIRASGQRLVGDLPERGELLLNQGEWRAAWWPFESQADAERARVMLAARGLKVEVVEF